jgi:hypothetical protein
MACSICDHTLQNVGVPTGDARRVFWCPRCGTLKTEMPDSELQELVDEPLWIMGRHFSRPEVLAIVKREPKMVEHIKRLDWQPPETGEPSAP